MARYNWRGMIGGVANKFREHKGEILAGASVAATIAAVVTAIRDTPKAVKLLDQRKEELGVEKLPLKEVVKTAGSVYIPTMLFTAASVGCCIGGCATMVKSNAVLASAAAISERALNEFKTSAREALGEKAEKQIYDKLAEKDIQQAPENVRHITPQDTGNGDVEFRDVVFGSVFLSDRDHVEKAVNQVNYLINRDGYASLNDFYVELGVDAVEIGENIGWHREDGLLRIVYSSILKDGQTPIAAINYAVVPHYDYEHGGSTRYWL